MSAEAAAWESAEAERERRGRTVLLRALPPTVTVPELRQAVPACKDVDLRTFRHRRPSGWAPRQSVGVPPTLRNELTAVLQFLAPQF